MEGNERLHTLKKGGGGWYHWKRFLDFTIHRKKGGKELPRAAETSAQRSLWKERRIFLRTKEKGGLSPQEKGYI